jgi:MerR family transcriptional regulator, copper efflux regulator
MSGEFSIGKVSKQTGLSTKTIRFYEDEGLVPRPRRSESGYRLYSEADVLRLGFIRRARLLGFDLPAIRTLLSKVTSLSCAEFGDELTVLLAAKRRDVEKRLIELSLLRDDIEALEAHVRHCCEGCDPSMMACDCSFCELTVAGPNRPSLALEPIVKGGV